MIDGNLPDMALQNAGQSNATTSAKISANPHEGQRSFAKFVEKSGDTQQTETDEPIAAIEDQEEQNEAPIDNKWMSQLLYLTRIAQQSDTTNLSAHSSLAAAIHEGETINHGKPVIAQNAADLDDRKAFAVVSKMLPQRGASALTHHDSEMRSSVREKADQDKNLFKSVSAGKSASAPLVQPTLSAGYNQGGGEVPSQQYSALKDQDISHLLLPQQKGMENSNIGNKVVLKNMATTTMPDRSAMQALEGVDIVHARKQGDLTLLQLQLTPENLGTVEAKLRLDKDHLSVELSTTKSETAKLLVKDHQLLLQTLEKAGFGGDARLSVSIIERSNVSGIQPVTTSFQANGQALSANHEGATGGREQNADGSTFSSHAGEKGQQSEQEGSRNRNAASRSAKPSLEKHPHEVGLSLHRLVV